MDDAVEGLLSLAPRAVEDACTTPPTQGSKRRTMLHLFRRVGVKRAHENELAVTYKSPRVEFTVSVRRGDTKDAFEARREQAARLALDKRRCLVYVSWSQTLVSMQVDLEQWTLFHKSVHQERYHRPDGGLQLVIQRSTCQQASGTATPCRACIRPQWRMSCKNITLRHYVRPLPRTRGDVAALSKELAGFGVEEYDGTSPTPWRARLPSLAVRAAISYA